MNVKTALLAVDFQGGYYVKCAVCGKRAEYVDDYAYRCSCCDLENQSSMQLTARPVVKLTK